MRVLIVEDETKVANALREGLKAEHYDVVLESTGDGAFRRCVAGAFDLVLLDLGLPGRDGMEVLSAIRARSAAVPVIVITARDALDARVAGLDAGADDYLVKPFAFAELLARVRALLRRGRVDDLKPLRVGSFTLDPAARSVTKDGRPIDLTNTEFELLAYLMRYAGQVVSREALSREVWKEWSRSVPLDNVIDVHMARLRRKLESDGAPRLLHTVRGVGFVMRERDH